MLAIEVEFLMGRATISRWEDRMQPEWPPHPQRLFSALVAAHGELDMKSSHEKALRWLENLPAPEIKADLFSSLRSSPSYFVPVNDEAIKAERGRIDFRHVLDRRNRQERFFPTVTPADPVVTFQWRQAPELDEHRAALRVLVENVTYLGHSSSPVRACLREAFIDPSLIPSDDGSISLRVPGPGRFDRLVAVHALRSEDESVQPPLGRIQSYERPDATARSVFSRDALVVALEHGPKLGLDSTLPLMQHVRNALLARLGSPSPEVLSGHDATGQMTREPHLAILPMGFVDYKHADGSVKGIAFVLPAAADDAVRRRLRSALSQAWQLQLGPLGPLSLRFVEPSSQNQLKSLQFNVYTKASDTWASVTPVVLDRYPKKRGATAETVIAAACKRIGLPGPVDVRIGSVSAVAGAPPVREFHGRAKQIDGRMRQHVLLRFEQPVRGPVMLGAGRFMGMGLLIPFRTSKP